MDGADRRKVVVAQAQNGVNYEVWYRRYANSASGISEGDLMDKRTVRPYPQSRRQRQRHPGGLPRKLGESLDRGVAGKINADSSVEAWSHIEGFFSANLLLRRLRLPWTAAPTAPGSMPPPRAPATCNRVIGQARRTCRLPPWSSVDPALSQRRGFAGNRDRRDDSTTAPIGCSPPTPSITTAASFTPTTTIASPEPRVRRNRPVDPGTRTPLVSDIPGGDGQGGRLRFPGGRRGHGRNM